MYVHIFFCVEYYDKSKSVYGFLEIVLTGSMILANRQILERYVKYHFDVFYCKMALSMTH